MRTGKRVLAGVAAVGLSAALVPFVGVGAAQAAATDIVFSAPDAARAGTNADANVTFTTTLASEFLCVAAITQPAGAAFTFVEVAAGAAGAQDVNFVIPGADIAQPGTYGLAFYQEAPATANCAALDTQTILGTANLVVGGSVASVSIAPSSATAVTDAVTGFAVSATDAQGRPTLFGAANAPAEMPAQSFSLTSNRPASLVFDDGNVTGGSIVGSTATSFTATNSVAQAATITLTPNVGAAATTATYTTVANVNATTVAIVSPVQSAGDANVPTGTTSVTFRVSAATAGTVGYTISGTGAAPAVSTVTIPASLSADVTVPVANSAAGRTVTLTTTLVGGGAGVARTATMVAPTPALIVPGAIVASVGGTVTVAGAVTDQYDRPIPGATVSGVVAQAGATPSQPAGVVTGADGSFTLTYTASTVTSTSQTQTVTVTANAPGAAPVVSGAIPVTFTESGSATLSDLILGTGGVTPAAFASTVQVPFAGFVNDEVLGTAGDTGNAVELDVTSSVAGVTVTYSSNDGLFLRNGPTGTPALWSAGSDSISTPAGTPIYFYSRTTGENTISVTAGGNALTATIDVVTDPTAARVIAVDPAEAEISTSEIAPVRVTVSDVFGNPVPGANTLSATVTGVGLLNGFNISIPALTPTDNNGQTAFTYVSQQFGEGLVNVVGTGAQFGTGNGEGFIGGVPVAGAPANVPSGTAMFTVEEPIMQSILITDWMRDNRRIEVSGVTEGFGMGAILKPWIRFPGQVGFSMGVANIEVDEAGEYVWGRNTGKRTAVQIRDEADTLRSNTVIIEAR